MTTTDHLTSHRLQEPQIHTVRWMIFTTLWHHKTHSPRASKDGSFDWFKSYPDISHIIHELIPDKSARILMLGCGNSRLSEEVSCACQRQISASSLRAYRCTMTDTAISPTWMSDTPGVYSSQADRLIPSTLPWSSTKCNDATTLCDREWDVGNFRSSFVCLKLIRS